LSLVASFLSLVQPLSCVFTAPSFQSFLQLLPGFLFAPRKTVTSLIRSSGCLHLKHFSSYHRLFSSARWSLDRLGLTLFRLLLPWCEALIELTLDDTLARKRGKKVWGAGMHHDPLLSSKKKTVLNYGHSWVVLCVALRFPFCPHKVFSLPVLFRLYLNHKAAARGRIKHKTRPQLGQELLQLLCSSFPERCFHLRADSTYGGHDFLAKLPPNCDLTSRLDLDARLYEAPPSGPRKGKGGRPRKRGERLPSPRQMLEARARRVSLDLYGRRDRVRLAEAEARWHNIPHRPLKIVAVEPLTGGRSIQAFYSTCHQAAGEEILRGYGGRWSIEETNQASKQSLGFEEPQSWSRRAVQRTAPVTMLLYSLIVLWFAQVGHRFYQAPERPWFPTKSDPSFADMLSTLKRQSLRQEVFSLLDRGRVRKKLLDLLLVLAHAGP
jgi:hypothetical protein